MMSRKWVIRFRVTLMLLILAVALFWFAAIVPLMRPIYHHPLLITFVSPTPTPIKPE
jgi:hypothetical protein